MLPVSGKPMSKVTWGRVDNATNADYAMAGALNLSASFTT